MQQVAQKNIETKHLSQVKARHQSYFTAKHYKYDGRFSLLVGYNIWPTSSSTNQNAALMIDHKLDFTNAQKFYSYVLLKYSINIYTIIDKTFQ